jgi:hypothetical protein
MDKKLDQILGYCGLYCGNCLYYQNTISGKDSDLEKCEGCNSGIRFSWCSQCRIRKCCIDRGIRPCIECCDYPCDRLIAYINEEDYPNHKEVPYNLERLKEIGLTAWAKEMDAKYTCPICGEKFTYFDMECPRCSR